MDLKELAAKPYEQLTQEEKTFLTSLGCGHCYFEHRDSVHCLTVLTGTCSCWYGVWKKLRTESAFR